MITDVLEIALEEIGIGTEAHRSESFAGWSWASLRHELNVTRKDDDHHYLLYVCQVCETSDPTNAMLMVNELNKRLLGVCFVALPIENQWSVFAFSGCFLTPDKWPLLPVYLASLRRSIGIVEALSHNEELFEFFDVSLPAPQSSDEHPILPNAVEHIARDVDPLTGEFAAGFWVSDWEAREFHEIMCEGLDACDNRQTDRTLYKSPFLEIEGATTSDVKVESSYVFGIGIGDESPFRGYDVKVDIETVRHRELGWGIQQRMTTPFFTTDEYVGNRRGEAEGLALANTLNYGLFRGYQGDPEIMPPNLGIGGWVNVHDQLYFGQFVPATVLTDLIRSSNHCIELSLFFLHQPNDAILRTTGLLTLLSESDRRSAREPDPSRDYWGGCTDYWFPVPVVSNPFVFEQKSSLHQWSSPVVIQLACWGFFAQVSGSPVSSLEVVWNEDNEEYELVYRVRHPHKPKQINLESLGKAIETDKIGRLAVDFLRGLGWPKIDWFLIQSCDFDEPLRRALREFASRISESTDVGKLISDMHQARTPWNLLANDRNLPNVFEYDNSIEAGFEWIVTRPDVIERAIARLRQLSLYSSALSDSGSPDYPLYIQTIWEFLIARRERAISVDVSYGQFLRDTYEVDDATVEKLMAYDEETQSGN